MRRISLILLIIAICFIATPIEAYWIWTPQTGKWTNPKYDAKPDPQQQFDYAMGFYNSGDYKRAIAEFNKLVRKFPKSKLAPEAQFFKGSSLEKLKDFYNAYLTYKKLVEKYPFAERISDILEAEFRIGNHFEESKPDLSVDIYSLMIEQSPYSDFSDHAQYKIGILHQKTQRHKEAKAAFDKLMKNYPDSKFFQRAKFQFAYSSYKLSLGPKYDQQQTESAVKEFQEFANETEDEELKKQAQEIIAELTDKQAEHAFAIAEFYRKLNKITSAVVYYEQIIKNYPQSNWAQAAKEKLQELQANK